jgi:hypothetical protein
MILEDIGVVAFEIVAVVSLGALTYLCDYFDVLPVAPAAFSFSTGLLLYSLYSKISPEIAKVFDDVESLDSDANLHDLLNLEKDVRSIDDDHFEGNKLQESLNLVSKSLNMTPADSGSSLRLAPENFQSSPNRNVVLPPIDLSALYRGKAKLKPVFSENDRGRSRKGSHQSSGHRRKPRREEELYSDNGIDHEKKDVKSNSYERADMIPLVDSRDVEEKDTVGEANTSDFYTAENAFGSEYKSHDGQNRDYDSGSDHDRERRRHRRRHRSRHRRRHHHESRGLRNDHRHRSHGDNYGSRRSEHYENRHIYDNDSQERTLSRPRTVGERRVQDKEDSDTSIPALYRSKTAGASRREEGKLDQQYDDSKELGSLLDEFKVIVEDDSHSYIPKFDEESLQLSWASLAQGTVVALDHREEEEY